MVCDIGQARVDEPGEGVAPALEAVEVADGFLRRAQCFQAADDTHAAALLRPTLDALSILTAEATELGDITTRILMSCANASQALPSKLRRSVFVVI